MKKSIKILSLVLAVALICGALVVGAFAAVADKDAAGAGVQVMAGGTFNDATVGATLNGKDTTKAIKPGKSGSFDNKDFEFNIGEEKRYGKIEVKANAHDNGNVYIEYILGGSEYVGGSGSSDPYFSTAYRQKNYTQTGADTYKYHVVDFDISFPTGETVTYITAGVEPRYTTSSDTTGQPKNSFVFSIFEDPDTGKVVMQDTVGYTSSIVLRKDNPNPKTELKADGTWNHITYIVRIEDTYAIEDTGVECEAGDVGAVAVHNYKGYIALNGVIVSEADYGNTLKVFSDKKDGLKSAKNGGYTGVYFTESRVTVDKNSNWNEINTNTVNSGFALDNYSWRAINPTLYDDTKEGQLVALLNAGVGADLNGEAGWTDSLYNAADIPFGNLIAQIGETKYDSLAKAIEAAGEGDTITLMANSNENVVVTKVVNIAKNGFAAPNLEAGTTEDEIMFTKDESEDTISFSVTQTSIKVTLSETCKCGKCYEAGTVIIVAEGKNIWDEIVATVGEINCTIIGDGNADYKFSGFTYKNTLSKKNFEKVYPDGFNKDVVVTEANVVSSLNFIPAEYEAIAVAARIYSGDKLVKTVYVSENKTLPAMVGLAASGQTLKLFADNKIVSDYKTVKINVTVDLNGYDFISSTTAKKGDGYFRVQGATFTLTSSVVGSEIFTVARDQNSSGTWRTDPYASPLMHGNGDNAIMKIIGRNEAGETTLTYYGNTVAYTYGKVTTVQIDGGNYVRTVQGFSGLITLRGMKGENYIKNANFYGDAIALEINKNEAASAKATLDIDNCVFTSTTSTAATILKHACDAVKITITNSYLDGKINSDSSYNSNTYNKPTGDETYIGEGCYLTDKCSSATMTMVNYVGTKAAISEERNYTFFKNAPKINTAEDGTVTITGVQDLTEVNKTVTYTSYVGTAVNVNWVDGDKVIGTTPGFAGKSSISPVIGDVEGTEGMVIYSYKYNIPADAKTDVTIDVNEAKDALEYVYAAGKVPMKMSITMLSHVKVNYFVPVVEGITYKTICGNYPSYKNENAANTNAEETEGVKYKVAPAYLYASWADETGIPTVKFTWNGMDFTYTAEKAIGPSNYFSAILNSNSYNATVKTAVADYVKYIDTYIAAKGETTTEIWKTLVASEAYTANVTATTPDFTGSTNAAAKAQMDADGIIKEMSVALTSDGGYSIFATVNDAENYAVKITSKENEAFAAQFKMKEDKCYTHNVRMYALNDVFTVEVYNKADTEKVNDGKYNEFKLKDGAEAVYSYEYTIAGYIADNALEGTDLALINAACNSATSSEAYLTWLKDMGFKVGY